MTSNDVSPITSSDSEVSEMEDYDFEVEGSPNSSSMASEEEGTQEAEAYADDPLADEEWLELYERDKGGRGPREDAPKAPKWYRKSPSFEHCYN